MVTGVRCAYRPPGGSIRHPCTACGRLFTLQRLGQELLTAVAAPPPDARDLNRFGLSQPTQHSFDAPFPAL